MRHAKRRYGFVIAGVGLTLAVIGGLSAGFWPSLLGPGRRDVNLPVVKVQRADVQLALTAGGTLESAKRTAIECQLEALSFDTRGVSLGTRGASRILTIVPEGIEVKKGDILCELDSADYEELARDQRLKVEEARADHRAAELKLQTCEASLHEFEDGLKAQTMQTLESAVTLAESNLQSARERLVFTEKLFSYQYVAPAQLTAQRLAVQKSEEALREAHGAVDQYMRYQIPKQDLTLRAAVDTARSQLSYQSLRLSRMIERLRQFDRQIALCTIRAPHDGFVIYATEDGSDLRIEPGTTVRNKQNLFYLPDLSRMQVMTLIHESQFDDIKPGQQVRVRVEAMADQELEGKITSIDPLPYRSKDWKANPDVKYFIAKIDLDEVLPGMRPGMSAGVEILAGPMASALVLPLDAIAYEDGEEVVYVSGAEGIERRLVSTRPATTDLVRVESGLAEGEEVILDPENHADLLPREEPAVISSVGP
ncbi:MAG: efflux RND transporter periplasmic adaptor subunit [Isosphaeraceae bacterium]